MPAPIDSVDEALKQWATETQARHIDAVNEHGSMRAAAKALDVNCRAIWQSITSVKRKASIHGYSPDHGMTRAVPDTHVAKGVSTYFDADGKIRGQWVKSSLDEQKAAEVRQAILEAFAEEVRGLAPLINAPEHVRSDLLAVYPWGDPHFGLYAWAKECGEAFDLVEAERLTLGAVDRLVASAPHAETAIILPLGDNLHANDQSNQTPAHKHQLDVDSRYPKVLGIAIKAIRHCVLRALQKHSRVIVRIEPGNHDPEAKWALAYALSAYFENESRVTVDLTPGKFWFYRFGSVLLGSTHGDTVKHDALLGVMAVDRAKDWGETKYRYWYTGHVHNQTVKELPGVVCESFRTLAAKDAYAAGHGYRAGRDMRLIVHHRDWGEIERHRCDVAMLEDGPKEGTGVPTAELPNKPAIVV